MRSRQRRAHLRSERSEWEMRFLSRAFLTVVSGSLKVLIKHRRYRASIISPSIRKNDDSTLITDERTLGGREKLKISTKCVESVELFNFSCAPIEWMNGVLCASCAPMCDVKRLASDSFDNLHKSLISLTPDTFSKHDPIFKTLLTHYWRHRSCIVCAFYWAPRGFYSSPPRLLIIIKSLKMVKNENEFPRRFMFILRFRYCWALSIISSPWRTKRLICYLFSKRARFGAYTMTSSSYSLRKAHYAR